MCSWIPWLINPILALPWKAGCAPWEANRKEEKTVNLATGWSDMHQRVGSPNKNTNRLFGLQWHAHKHQEKQGLQTKDSLLVLAGLLMARYNVINNQMTWRNVPVETESRAGFSISCAFKNCRSDTHGCQASGLSHVQLQTVRFVDPTWLWHEIERISISFEQISWSWAET